MTDYDPGTVNVPPDDPVVTDDPQHDGGIYFEPPELGERSPWADVNRQRFAPYRGTQQHGVQFNHPVSEWKPNIKGAAPVVDDNPSPVKEELVAPVPVRIVNVEPLAVSKRVATNMFSFPAVNTPIQVCARKNERTRVTLVNLTTDIIAVGATPDKDALGQIGFRLPQNQIFSLDCTEPLWAVDNTGGTANALAILEEFTITSGGDVS